MGRKNRIGEQFTNREDLGNCSFIIVEYRNANDLWIEFQDNYKARIHTSYQNCKKGEVKNPYHKSILGVACLGLMSDGTKPKTKINGITTKEYSLWFSMVSRCYSEKTHEKQPTYKNCKVSNRWLVFANFLEDLPLIEGYEMWINNSNPRAIQLDKDIKGGDKKLYSLETCMFIDQADNVRESNSRNKQNVVKVVGTNAKTGETVMFESIALANLFLGLKTRSSAISNCIHGRSKTAGGYHWQEVGE